MSLSSINKNVVLSGCVLVALLHSHLASSFTIPSKPIRHRQWKGGLVCSSTLSELHSSTSSVTYREPWVNGNVRTISQSVKPLRNPFQKLVPVVGKGCDESVEWKDPREGATELVTRCFGRGYHQDAINVLTEALENFRVVVAEDNLSVNSFKARIVATRGPLGTKCPRWHYDHVPVRQIQALVGPGCEYVVTEEGVRRSFINQADDLETERANNDMVDPNIAGIRSGREGEALVLRGMTSTSLHNPAIHKSPALCWWQGRVLLTVDVVA